MLAGRPRCEPCPPVVVYCCPVEGADSRGFSPPVLLPAPPAGPSVAWVLGLPAALQRFGWGVRHAGVSVPVASGRDRRSVRRAAVASLIVVPARQLGGPWGPSDSPACPGCPGGLQPRRWSAGRSSGSALRSRAAGQGRMGHPGMALGLQFCASWNGRDQSGSTTSPGQWRTDSSSLLEVRQGRGLDFIGFCWGFGCCQRRELNPRPKAY